jgi:hypothetical protein
MVVEMETQMRLAETQDCEQIARHNPTRCWGQRWLPSLILFQTDWVERICGVQARRMALRQHVAFVAFGVGAESATSNFRRRLGKNPFVGRCFGWPMFVKGF